MLYGEPVSPSPGPGSGPGPGDEGRFLNGSSSGGCPPEPGAVHCSWPESTANPPTAHPASRRPGTGASGGGADAPLMGASTARASRGAGNCASNHNPPAAGRETDAPRPPARLARDKRAGCLVVPALVPRAVEQAPRDADHSHDQQAGDAVHQPAAQGPRRRTGARGPRCPVPPGRAASCPGCGPTWRWAAPRGATPKSSRTARTMPRYVEVVPSSSHTVTVSPESLASSILPLTWSTAFMPRARRPRP